MPGEPDRATMEALREDVRRRELLEFEIGGVRTAFFDQQGLLAACHRIGQFYESGMLARIAELGREGTYLDVGANVGNHSVFFAQHCPSTTVHAFEPLDFVYAHLVENVALNGLSNVVLHPYGLGDTTGQVTTRMGRRTYRIWCRRLDEIRIPGPVAVLKVDIEGMEPAFLEGAVETLRRERPVIYIEAHTESELARSGAVLGDLSYRRTGRVFNATPTYEFAPQGDPLLDDRPRRAALRTRVARRVKRGLSVRP